MYSAQRESVFCSFRLSLTILSTPGFKGLPGHPSQSKPWFCFQSLFLGNVRARDIFYKIISSIAHKLKTTNWHMIVDTYQICYNSTKYILPVLPLCRWIYPSFHLLALQIMQQLIPLSASPTRWGHSRASSSSCASAGGAGSYWSCCSRQAPSFPGSTLALTS